jgi:hypothetical protein
LIGKGKRTRKVPKDIKVITVDHFPDDMGCGTCGHDLKSIKREKRVGILRIVPEHVVLVKNVYHTVTAGSVRRTSPWPQSRKTT